MSQTIEPEQPAYRRLGCRTVAEIERKVIKHGKRNVALKFVLAKGDKDKIAAWKQDLIRFLQVFNVRSIRSAFALTNLPASFRPN